MRKILFACWLALLTGSCPDAFPAQRFGSPVPNIVFILMDDLGWADVGCNGSTFYQTPNIDRMAREGMRFTHAYAAASICSPTRAALLTGRHPARLHLTDWLPGRPDRADQKMARPTIITNLPAGMLTLPRALKAAGYVTALVGKWHLGGAGAGPLEAGFDVNIAGDHTGTPLSYFAPFSRGKNVMPGLERSEPGEYLTERLTTEAEKFIETNREKPFFLYLPHYAVHTPLTARLNLVAKYRALSKAGATQTNEIYAAMIESMDDSVGRVLRKLEELHLSTNTLVIFTSDNGGLSVREGPATPATSNAPLRAGKGHLYEGGIRVPLIARWPGVVPSGTVEAAPVVTTDWFATILALAGGTLRPEAGFDAENLLPLLRREAGMARSNPLFWHYPHYSNQGGKPGGAVREGDWKLIEFYESGYLELFNLKDDPSEKNNLAGTQPQRANDLAKKLADWRRSVGAQVMSTNAGYEPVPILQAADGTITLHARDVTIHGVNVRYEPPAHKNTIGYWTRKDDWVSWDFTVAKRGKFRVEVLQGCGKGSGGSDILTMVERSRFKVQGSKEAPAEAVQTLRFTVQDTGHFQNFVARDIGEVQLPAGRFTLSVKPQTKPGVAVMDLRQVTLKPASD
jgi:arylsulfatase A